MNMFCIPCCHLHSLWSLYIINIPCIIPWRIVGCNKGSRAGLKRSTVKVCGFGYVVEIRYQLTYIELFLAGIRRHVRATCFTKSSFVKYPSLFVSTNDQALSEP